MNKQLLKELNIKIRLYKDARKPSHEKHEECYPYYVFQIFGLRFEARCRGIAQAFKKRNISLEDISTEDFFKVIDIIEPKLRRLTPMIDVADIYQYWKENE